MSSRKAAAGTATKRDRKAAAEPVRKSAAPKAAASKVDLSLRSAGTAGKKAGLATSKNAPKSNASKSNAPKGNASKSAVKSPARKSAKNTAPENDLSTAARALAAGLEKQLAAGAPDLVSEPAFQALMAALCKTYAVKLQDGDFLPLASVMSVTPTDVMLTTGALLKAANLQVFELGMWQSWTGR